MGLLHSVCSESAKHALASQNAEAGNLKRGQGVTALKHCWPWDLCTPSALKVTKMHLPAKMLRPASEIPLANRGLVGITTTVMIVVLIVLFRTRQQCFTAVTIWPRFKVLAFRAMDAFGTEARDRLWLARQRRALAGYAPEVLKVELESEDDKIVEVEASARNSKATVHLGYAGATSPNFVTSDF